MDRKDDFNGWPDRMTRVAVEWFPNSFLTDVFNESLSEKDPRKWFAKTMTLETESCHELVDRLNGEKPDWGDVFDSLIEEGALFAPR